MQNLIQSPALYEILKKPLLGMNYVDEDSNDVPPNKCAAPSLTTLNINAREFVPRGKTDNSSQGSEQVNLSALKCHFEALDDSDMKQLPQHNLPTAVVPFQCADAATEVNVDLNPEDRVALKKPQLMLPWKGFPKPLPHVRSTKTSKYVIPQIEASKRDDKTTYLRRANTDFLSLDTASKDVEHSKYKMKMNSAFENIEIIPKIGLAKINKPEMSEKKLEQDRQRALEALMLLDQRRKRELVKSPADDEHPAEPVLHTTRSPIDYTAVERVRVNRLREKKREHIERVLSEMQQESRAVAAVNSMANCKSIERIGRIRSCSENPPNTDKSAELCSASCTKYVPPDIILHMSKLSPEQAEEQDNKNTVLEPEPEYTPPHPKRYVCLRRATAPIKLEDTAAPAEETPAAERKRYIPTTKEWDQQCRVKRMQAAAFANVSSNNNENKENIESLELIEPKKAEKNTLIDIYKATNIQLKGLQKQTSYMPRTLMQPTGEKPKLLNANDWRSRAPLTDQCNKTNSNYLQTDPPAESSNEKPVVACRNGSASFNSAIIKSQIKAENNTTSIFPEPVQLVYQPPGLVKAKPEKVLISYDKEQLMELKAKSANMGKPPIEKGLFKLGFIRDDSELKVTSSS